MTDPLSRALTTVLNGLADAGGAAELDIHGRLVAGPNRHPLPGDSVSWLVLVSRGLVAGEDGKVILTQQGRAAAINRLGRVREAAN